jgi:hypothetical protein
MGGLELLFEAFKLLGVGGQDIGTVLYSVRHSLFSVDVLGFYNAAYRLAHGVLSTSLVRYFLV